MNEDAQRILFANEAFYAAFAAADMQAMAETWSDRNPVSVVHPGAPAIFGRDAVLRSWHEILDGSARFDIAMADPQVSVIGASGLVVCHETVGRHSLIATNLFLREGMQWRMVHHHSAPGPAPRARSETGPPGSSVH